MKVKVGDTVLIYWSISESLIGEKCTVTGVYDNRDYFLAQGKTFSGSFSYDNKDNFGSKYTLPNNLTTLLHLGKNND